MSEEQRNYFALTKYVLIGLIFSIAVGVVVSHICY
jgi:hypothetical protein